MNRPSQPIDADRTAHRAGVLFRQLRPLAVAYFAGRLLGA